MLKFMFCSLSAALLTCSCQAAELSSALKEELASKFLTDSKTDPVKAHTDLAASAPKPEDQEDILAKASDQDMKNFWSNFGVGFAFDKAWRRYKGVKSVSTDANGVLRVTEDDDVSIGFALEAHRYLWGTTWGGTGKHWKAGVAVGPYVAVIPGSGSNIVNAVSLGLMIGLVGNSTPPDLSSSEKSLRKLNMNIGLGAFAAPNSKVLANGYEDGKAVPAGGNAQAATKTTTAFGTQVVASFSYDF